MDFYSERRCCFKVYILWNEIYRYKIARAARFLFAATRDLSEGVLTILGCENEPGMICLILILFKGKYVQPYSSKGFNASFKLLELNVSLCRKITKICTPSTICSHIKQVRTPKDRCFVYTGYNSTNKNFNHHNFSFRLQNSCCRSR